MRTHLTVIGNLTSNPSSRWLKDGTHVAEFGLAHNDRRQNRATGLWENGGTTFYTVTCWRKVADNVRACLQKGDPVVVHATFTTHDYERRDGTIRSELRLEGHAVGADLARTMATVIRLPRPFTAPSSEPEQPIAPFAVEAPPAEPFDEEDDDVEPDPELVGPAEPEFVEAAPAGRS